MPTAASALHHAATMEYVVAPAIAIAVMGLLALVTRWAFGPDRSRGRPPATDDGLLVRVATVSRRELTRGLQAALREAGIASTLRDGGAHLSVVLVFPEDAERARAVAASFPVPE